jgi:transcription elongation GreA/GreB family factor
VDKAGNLARRVTVEYARHRRMNKRALIRKIIARLTDELEVYFRAARASRAEATHEQSKAENKYDTRGLEASYLARGQSRQAAEIQGAIAAFEKLDARKFGPGEPIDVGAFVELAFDREKTAYFIGPRAGGTEVLHEKREILVITPQSPLGEQLLGRRQGDVLKLKLADAQNQYRVAEVV